MCVKAAFLPVFTLNGYHTMQSGCMVTPINSIAKHLSQLSDAHMLDAYSILICSNGIWEVQLDNVTIALPNNKVLCIGPGSVMRLHLGEQTSGWMIQFSSHFFNFKSFENLSESYTCFKQNSYCLQSLNAIEMEQWHYHLMQMQFENQSQSNDVMLQAHLKILLESLKRKNRQPQFSKKRTEKDRKILVFEQLVETHYRKLKLPSGYAAEMFVSVNYLNRICQNTRNLSSGEIIRNRIILEAERLLLHTDHSISEIALTLGFDSLSYFVTFFKKQKGQSPELYRKSNT